ncbi:MAG: hypothetical protein HRU04_08760 [Oceanospirillaceae bacterium]|nr:hypothetical protein [Oceanospirillaceae bacterium]
MELGKTLFILIVLVAIAVPLFRLIKARNSTCTKCGGKLILDELTDPTGININKKLTISLYQGPRKYKEEWKCEVCGEKTITSYWGG